MSELNKLSETASLPPLFTTPKMSSDLHDLQKWSVAFRGEQLHHLLHSDYASGMFVTVVCSAFSKLNRERNENYNK